MRQLPDVKYSRGSDLMVKLDLADALLDAHRGVRVLSDGIEPIDRSEIERMVSEGGRHDATK